MQTMGRGKGRYVWTMNFRNVPNLSLLKQDLEQKKQMVLFVGAGINFTPGVDLSWNALLDYLFDATLRYLALEKDIPVKESMILREVSRIGQDFKGMSAHTEDWHCLHASALAAFPHLVKASILKSVFDDRYISLIREFLYSRCDEKRIALAFKEQYRRNPEGRDGRMSPYFTLFQVARMILLCPLVKAVVSYNYDNFLTKAIRILQNNADEFFSEEEKACLVKRDVRDIFGDSYVQRFDQDALFVYHVHGYIPHPSEIVPDQGNEIVLSMDEYYENSKKVHSWQTATQLHFLSHYTCVFAGTSLVDITTQRMIYYTREHGNDANVYLLTANSAPSFSDMSYAGAYEKLDKIKNSFYTSYGLRPIYHPEGYYALYRDLGRLVWEELQRDNGYEKSVQ